MMKNYQDFDQEFEEKFDEEFDTMLRFNPTAVDCDNQPTSTITEVPVSCALCHGSMKKRSHLSPCLQEPASKKANCEPSSSSATVNGSDHLTRGYTKLPLPVIPQNPSPTDLRRTVSDPTGNTAFGSFLNHRSPEASKNSIPAASPSPEKVASGSFLPPLQRSISTPIPLPYQQTTSAANTLPQFSTSPSPAKVASGSSPAFLTPLQPTMSEATAANTLPPIPRSRESSQSPGFGEKSMREDGPNSKRLKRMEEQIKEMKRLCHQLTREVKEEPSLEDNTKTQHAEDNTTTQHEHDVYECDNEEEPREEAVWVERKGGFLVIHFKCPCGEGYKIVISGNNCYYRLI